MCLYYFHFFVFLVLQKKEEKNQKYQKNQKKNASKSLGISLCIVDSSINQLLCRMYSNLAQLIEDPYISISPLKLSRYLYTEDIVHLKWGDGR